MRGGGWRWLGALALAALRLARPGAAMAVKTGSFAEQISCCMKQDS